MRFKEWLKDIFLTQPQLVTGKRLPRWRRISIAGVSVFFLLMISMAVFGEASTQPDFKNYQALTPEEMSKHGVMVLSGKDREALEATGKQHKSYTIADRNYSGSGADQGQVISRKDRAHGEYVIPAGSRAEAVLDGDLNSELSQSPVVAQLVSGFSFGGRTLLPAGTKFLGRAGQGQDSERVAVTFDQIVLPNGHQISAGGMAIMQDGSPGVVGDFHSNKGWKVAGALGSSFLSGAASAFQTTQGNAFGIQQPEGSTRNAILNGVAQTTLDQGKRFSEEAQNANGYVTVPSGTRFQIYIERETDLSGALQ
ncbi:MAG: TrbI/VirB10 family protein [Oligoflexia bacterium]|nr:TrbI/VirB10 family protein [Oligoflexia bacterium]